MASYLYFNCGCGFCVDDGDWSCEDLCDNHKKELCKEDLGGDEF